MTPVLNLVLGFVVVMAGVSMIVSIVVAAILRLDNRRSRQLAEMLAAANYGFRSHHGDRGRADDEAAAAFVEDVLADVALRATPALADPLSRAANKRSPIEYVALADLLEVIKRRANGSQLPASWHRALPGDVATVDALSRWLSRWFPTVEANASDRFRRETQRLVAVISGLAVVLLNLDAIQLSVDLFDQSALASSLSDHAEGLGRLADTPRSQGQAAPSSEVAGDLIQINSLLNVPELRLGWQRSTFVEHFCAWRENCSLPISVSKKELPRDHLDFALYAARWFSGLVCAALLLGMGAPFWSDKLRALLRLRSALEQKRQPTPPEEGAGAATPAQT